MNTFAATGGNKKMAVNILGRAWIYEDDPPEIEGWRA